MSIFLLINLVKNNLAALWLRALNISQVIITLYQSYLSEFYRLRHTRPLILLRM